mmetsp:Transcript_19656/g.39433  ORF Transcript_19656/g.39433 Transcript_19656/m.39433 type:complete len:782 (-) Transcript_19656:3176-5521(-)
MASKTSGSVVDVLDRVIGIPSSKSSSDGNNDNNIGSAEFIPSKTFTGSKKGYVFRTSEEFGTGYHLDSALSKLTTPSTPADTANKDKKRPRSNDSDKNDNDNGAPTKRSIRWGNDTTLSIPSRDPKPKQPTPSQLLAIAEASLESHPTSCLKLLTLNPSTLQSASISLSRTLEKNQLLRAQHADDPEKFMMNELALNDEICGFQAVAVDVSMYGYLVEFDVIKSFLALLSHENGDVAMSVVNVLVELLDPLLLREDEEKAGEEEGKELSAEVRRRNVGLLARTFVDGGGLELLVSNIGRLEENVEAEAKGIEDILTLMESLLDLDRAGVLQQTSDNGDEEENKSVSVMALLCKQTLFLSWLFGRIEKKNEIDATATAPTSPVVLKLHASEVLSTILQHEDYSMQRCGDKLSCLPKYTCAFDDLDEKPAAISKSSKNDVEEKDEKVDGMEVLLQSIAVYRKADPQTEVECEFLENTFDALAATLLREDNVENFVEYQGIELMLRCLREKVHSGGGALKVLNFAVSGSARSVSEEAATNITDGNIKGVNDAYKKACETFIQAGGLKVIFPLFMARKGAIPCPALCSEAGSNLAKKAMSNSAHKDDNAKGALSKRAKKAAHARKKWLAEVEQNVIYIMYALTRYIDEKSPHDAHARLLVKFVEEDCEKCDRAVELCLKYDEKARIAEYHYFKSDEAEEAEQLGADVDLAALDAKLRNGGDVFHRGCAILSFACAGSTRCHRHVRDQLKLQGSGISVIKAGLAEFSSLLINGSQKDQIENYLSSI